MKTTLTIEFITPHPLTKEQNEQLEIEVCWRLKGANKDTPDCLKNVNLNVNDETGKTIGCLNWGNKERGNRK